MQETRTSLPEAAITILETLKKEKSLSVNALSKETKLNRRTVEKALKLLIKIQPYFQEMKISAKESDWKRIIEVKEQTGMLSLPEEVQNLIIRTVHYPTPSEQEIVLIYLFLNNAVSPENAVAVSKSRAVKKLLEQGQIQETKNKLYLSDEGKIVAQGVIEIFPELLEMNKPIEGCAE